jgi:hypothetical protein
MMTKKVHQQIARAVSATYPGIVPEVSGLLVNPWYGMVNDLCRIFKQDNPRFDVEGFLDACKQKHKPGW